MKKRSLTKRDLEVLRELAAFNDDRGRVAWARPMDVGGHDASYHSHTLAKLARHGLVDVRDNWKPWGRSGSKSYRITPAGRKRASL